MEQKLNPQKYTSQINKIQEQAKTEIIELLKNNPKGRYIWFDWDEQEELGIMPSFEITNDEGWPIRFSSIGLDEDDNLCFSPDDEDEDEWRSFEEFDGADYAQYYEFVAEYLDYAKDTGGLSEYEDDEDD